MSPEPVVVAIELDFDVPKILQKPGISEPPLGDFVPSIDGPNPIVNAPVPQSAIFDSGENTTIPVVPMLPLDVAKLAVAYKAVPLTSPVKLSGANPMRAQIPFGSGPLGRHSCAAFVRVVGSNVAWKLTVFPGGIVDAGIAVVVVTGLAFFVAAAAVVVFPPAITARKAVELAKAIASRFRFIVFIRVLCR
jgi:hypothetical protein